jgi:alpha-tubulin suppressor-like RCC1 family protein
VTTTGVLSGLTLTQISAALGGSTTCALSSAGAAYCWGLGSSGQLGNGSTTAAQTTAVAVTATGVLSGVTLTQLGGGQDQTCALGSTGVAYCWGGNGSGDLGINSTTQSLVPAAVNTSGVLSGKVLTQISMGGNFISCALGSFGQHDRVFPGGGGGGAVAGDHDRGRVQALVRALLRRRALLG